MDKETPRVFDLAKKKVNPTISITDRHAIENLNARVSFKIADDKISKFIIDFTDGNSTHMYHNDLVHLRDNFERIEYVRISDSFVFNEFVQNHNPNYKLSPSLTIEMILPGNIYESAIRLTGKKKNYLQFNFIK